MEVTGSIKGISLDLKNGKAQLTLQINDKQAAMNLYDNYNTMETLSIKIDKFRQKRSLDANAYCWGLIDKLAAKVNLSREDVYKQAIREIGGVSDTVCVKDQAVDKLCEQWQKNGIGWQAECFPSKIPGCTNVTLFYGSSTYDTAQMSRLIDSVIQDCKAVGIETRTPAEIQHMLDLWEDAH